MAMTTTEVIGFCDGVTEFMQNNKAALAAKGLNVDNWVTELGTQKGDAVTKNDQQEAFKAQLRTKTDDTQAALKTAYDSASTKLDGCIGSMGKTSELGKQAARLRSSIRRDNSKPTPTPPNP
jgi:hypothetical protein